MNVRRWWVGLGVVLTAGLSACSPQDGAAQTGQAQTTQQTPTKSTPTRSTQPRTDPKSGLPFIAAVQLPREGQQTLRLIAAGGPFAYAKDGVSFGNREKVLPQQPRNYYREYTVKTPGEGDRGARRIVCGGAQAGAECYYTADHYASFQRIRP
ncbi:ribonuclease domain-containing protein [Deinococcus oregonensis]|uniref:Ribonuclease domain-containing protein n=1 Tax=Deinococcus oregonensis TaxID=1805970 RepID=A0ABV6B9Y7_9DEIO